MKNKKTLLGIGLSGLALASFLLILAKSDVAIAECGVNECCWECKANFYRSGISCLACPDGTSSASGSDSLDDCKQAGCGAATLGLYKHAPSNMLCELGSSSNMATGDSQFTWNCTYLDNIANCSAKRIYDCGGNTPSCDGVKLGTGTHDFGYTPASWTYKASGTLGKCEWNCDEGYEKSGNCCVVKSAQCGTATVNWYVTAPTESLCTYGTPSIVTSGNNKFTWTCTNLTSTDNCSATRKYSCGTAPSGNGVSKGSYFRDYNYTPASWTYSTNSPLGECEWSCKDGYEKSGNTCVASSAQCGPAYGGTYTSAPTTGLCDLGDSSVVTPWDFTYTWTCTHLTNTANCNATRNHFCEGTTPSGDGVNRGLMTASTPKDWTYKAEGTLGECEWSCDEGYTSGANNTCVSLPAQCGTPDGGLVAPTTGLCNRGTPSSVNTGDSEFTWTCSYQGNSINCSAPRTYLCNGTTPPTSNGTLKGSFTREYSYAPTSWTYKADGELGPCQWRCKGGYLSGGGNTCIASDFKELEMYFLTDTGATGHSVMMDRNLGATAYLNEPGKTTGEWYGSYYQWGNNYGFPNQGTVNTSSTQVNASSYGPSNPYSSDIFITSSFIWDSSDNANLWGGTSSLISDKKGPCPPNYHVPTKDEFVALVNGWKKAMNDTSTSQYNSIPGMTSQWSLDSLMPFAGHRSRALDAGVDYQESRGLYWTSMRDSTDNASALLFTSYINPQHYLNRASGAPVRCFRNLQTPSTTLHPNGGTGAVIVVHDGTITKLGTPTKGTEVFGGWYRNEGLTSEVLLNQTAPTHLYAKWETAQCGTANGQSYLSLTSLSAGLCGTGTVGNFSSSTTGFTWKCTYQTNVASCSASRASVCSGTVPHGDRVVTGASTYSNGYTPTSWTYKAEGELGACQWRCTAGYMQGPDNTCVVGVGQCGTAAGNSHTDLSESSANLCAGGQVVQFSQRGATYYWKCYGLSNQVQCCATQSIERNNRVQEGAGTLKICNPNNSEECLTLQNHDLGSSVPGLCSPSYGKFYQRGNNYGFANSGSVSASTTQVTCNNPPYNRSQFVIGFDNWCAESQSSVLGNLWGGYTDFSNLNTNYGYPMLNSTDRQGPCPSGYHVPSKGEWQKVMEWRVAWYNLDGNSLTIDTSSNNYKFSNGTAIKMFQNDFLIPLAGHRLNTSSTVITNQFATAWLRTSSPKNSDSSSFHLYLDNLGIGSNDRADGVSVRCFKDNTLSQCGPASTGSFVTAPTDSLCNPGTPSAVTSGSSTFTWTCTYGASVSNCSATRMYPCGGTTPSGNGVTKGGVMATTSKSWTYKANGELGACEWRCNGGYTQGTNNTCDAAGYSDLEMYFLTDAGATGYYAMMDRNLGATAYMNEPGKTASEWYGNYFQWGNNYGFPNTGTVKTSTTMVDASGYGPGNYYSSDTFIQIPGDQYDWANPGNDNLWGGVTNTNTARQGPCPVNYHVPTKDEFVDIVDNYWKKSTNYANSNIAIQWSLDSLMSMPAHRSFSSTEVYPQGSDGYYWSSSPYSNSTYAYALDFYSPGIYPQGEWNRGYGFSVRCLKNTQTPSRTINPNGGTGALIVVHDGVITKLGTPTKGTQVFGGWYRDSSFSSQVHTGENMPNLYAKWEVAQCGSASGQSYVSLTSSSAGLCSKGSAGNFSTSNTGYTWKCTYGANVANCSAIRVYTCGGTLPHGDYVVTGASTYTNGYTPTSWTYVAGNGTLGTCQWSCDEGYTSGANNTCVELQAQCGTAAGNSHTNLSASSANLCAGGEVTQFFQAGATYSWSCVVSSNNKQQCCATQSLSRDSRIQLGDGTFTICNPNNSDECLTIQNRDVGSNTPGLCPPSYGNFYQRGNSYGFSSSGNVSTSSTQVTCSNPPYNRSQFVVGFKNRCTGAQNNVMGNLWGGYLDVSNLNTHYGYPMLNQTDRQGPCPSGYHVPSISEWRKVIDWWVDRYNGAGNSVTIGDQGNQHIIVSDGMAAKMFQNDFLIPFAGLRERTAGEISNQRISSFLWTSTPLGSIGGATAFGLDSNHFGLSDNDRAYGDSVRCFKNYTLPQCGSASGQTYVTLTNTSAGLCDASNTVLDFQSLSNKFTWKCGLGGVTVDCGATRRYNCEGQMPSGAGVSTGSNIVNTPTDWTYSPTGTLGACQWRCVDGYVLGTNNTCVEAPDCGTYYPSNFQDLDMYFVTSTGAESHYTLMDRNLGATQVYDGTNNECSHGYHYQWGNNYGFPNRGMINTSTTRVNASGYGPNNPYSSGTFIMVNSNDWSSYTNNNLWGGETNTNEAMRGPCPEGYHVPTHDQQVDLFYNLWMKTYNYPTNNQHVNNIGTQWALDSLMPFAGTRRSNEESISIIDEDGLYYGDYWSSSKTSNYNNSYFFMIDPNYYNLHIGTYRSNGLSVRCFKNAPNSNLTIHRNGGTGAMIIVHGGVITKLGTPTRGTITFLGWYRDSSFTSQVHTGEVAPTDLYAKWNVQCQAGYYSNRVTCVQCTAGYYCPGDNTRHPCGAGKYSLAGATSCLNVACGCKGTSTTATTSCPTVCPDGQYSSAGSSTCQYCGNGPSNSVYTHSSSRLCTNSCPWMCADGFVEKDGECVCEAGTYFDEGEGKCLTCPDGYKKGGAGAVGIEQCMAHCEGGTYIPEEKRYDKECHKCPNGTAIPEHEVAYGSISIEMGEAFKCQDCKNLPKEGNAHYTGPSNDITTCPWECDADRYRDNEKNLCNTCSVGLGYHSDAGSDSEDDCIVTCAGGTHVATSRTACVACPEGMAVASHQVHRGSTSTCGVPCNEEYLPTNATFSGAGSNPNNCPWKCKAGYYKSGNVCRSCSEFNTSSVQYSSHTGATSPLDCFQLPECGSSNGQYFIIDDYPSGPNNNLCNWGSNTTVNPTYATVGELTNVHVGWAWKCQYSGYSVSCSATKTNRYTSCDGTKPSGDSSSITYGAQTYTGTSQLSWSYQQSGTPGACRWNCKAGYVRLGNLQNGNGCRAAACWGNGGNGGESLTFHSNGCYKLSTQGVACNNSRSFPAGCSCTAIYGPYENGCYACMRATACFISGTKVLMSDGGQKNIEDIKIGEKVLGTDGKINTVLGFHKPLLGDKELWSINGGEYFVTAEHPFMTIEGWKSLDPELSMQGVDIEVSLLKVGDVLITDNGEVKVYSLESKKAKSDTQLYNLVLDGDHTYYANGYLVHNKGAEGSNNCMTTPVPSAGSLQEEPRQPEIPGIIGGKG